MCACEDFTDHIHSLFEFENLALSINPDKKIGTELNDILEVIDLSFSLIPKDTKEKFWDMFIIDALNGNTDRHNGNWGFLRNSENKKITFAPIYDCGSSLNPLLDDKDIKQLDDSEIKNLALNCYSCFKKEGKKINYLSYIKSKNNKECNLALKRIFPLIDYE